MQPIQGQPGGGAEMVSVQIPAGATAGSVLKVTAPSGAQVQVQVPVGVAPGTVIQVATGGAVPGPPTGGVSVDAVAGAWCVIHWCLLFPAGIVKATVKPIDANTFSADGCAFACCCCPCPMSSTFRRSQGDPNKFDERESASVDYHARR